MFVQKIQVSIILIILTATAHISEATIQVLDSVGRMPEITVTAPRYEYQDEAWAGMVEGVIVEARRPISTGDLVTAAGNESAITFVGNILSKDVDTSCLCLSLVLTLTLVPLSIIYISLGAYLVTKEVKK